MLASSSFQATAPFTGRQTCTQLCSFDGIVNLYSPSFARTPRVAPRAAPQSSHTAFLPGILHVGVDAQVRRPAWLRAMHWWFAADPSAEWRLPVFERARAHTTKTTEACFALSLSQSKVGSRASSWQHLGRADYFSGFMFQVWTGRRRLSDRVETSVHPVHSGLATLIGQAAQHAHRSQIMTI